VTTAKPFTIPKRLVYEAFQAVKANAGSAGVDKETIEDFEKGNCPGTAIAIQLFGVEPNFTRQRNLVLIQR
jgi:hypothetical protein